MYPDDESAEHARCAGPDRACSRRPRPPASGGASASASRASGCPGRYRESRQLGHDALQLLLARGRRAAPRRRRTAGTPALPRRRRSRPSSVPSAPTSGWSTSGSDSSSSRSKTTSTPLPPPSWSSEKRDATGVVERAELSVEHDVGRADREGGAPRDVLEPFREVVVVPALNDTSPPDTVTIARNPSHFGSYTQPSPAGSDVGRDGEHRPVPRCAAFPRVLAQQQPVLGVAVEVRRYERPHAVEPLAVEADGQAAVALLLQQLVRAPVPDLDRAGAVLARGNRALEVGVLERVILDVHGEMPLPAPERNPFRHGPAGERPVALEPEVVVQPPRGMALDHEARSLVRPVAPVERLGRPVAAALTAVLVEAHLWIVARTATCSSPTGCKMGVFPAQTALGNRG